MCRLPHRAVCARARSIFPSYIVALDRKYLSYAPARLGARSGLGPLRQSSRSDMAPFVSRLAAMRMGMYLSAKNLPFAPARLLAIPSCGFPWCFLNYKEPAWFLVRCRNHFLVLRRSWWACPVPGPLLSSVRHSAGSPFRSAHRVLFVRSSPRERNLCRLLPPFFRNDMGFGWATNGPDRFQDIPGLQPARPTQPARRPRCRQPRVCFALAVSIQPWGRSVTGSNTAKLLMAVAPNADKQHPAPFPRLAGPKLKLFLPSAPESACHGPHRRRAPLRGRRSASSNPGEFPSRSTRSRSWSGRRRRARGTLSGRSSVALLSMPQILVQPAAPFPEFCCSRLGCPVFSPRSHAVPAQRHLGRGNIWEWQCEGPCAAASIPDGSGAESDRPGRRKIVRQRPTTPLADCRRQRPEPQPRIERVEVRTPSSISTASRSLRRFFRAIPTIFSAGFSDKGDMRANPSVPTAARQDDDDETRQPA